MRLRELRQIVTPNSFEAGAEAMGGELLNVARWDLAQGPEEEEEHDEEEDGYLEMLSPPPPTTTTDNFDCTGTFTAKCTYAIRQGSRMETSLVGHVLEPQRGSPIPRDVQGLVGKLFRTMPTEMFDPTGLKTLRSPLLCMWTRG